MMKTISWRNNRFWLQSEATILFIFLIQPQEYDTFLISVYSRSESYTIKEVESLLLAQEGRIEKHSKELNSYSASVNFAASDSQNRKYYRGGNSSSRPSNHFNRNNNQHKLGRQSSFTEEGKITITDRIGPLEMQTSHSVKFVENLVTQPLTAGTDSIKTPNLLQHHSITTAKHLCPQWQPPLGLLSILTGTLMLVQPTT